MKKLVMSLSALAGLVLTACGSVSTPPLEAPAVTQDIRQLIDPRLEQEERTSFETVLALLPSEYRENMTYIAEDGEVYDSNPRFRQALNVTSTEKADFLRASSSEDVGQGELSSNPIRS
jgi:hypothetical protein